MPHVSRYALIALLLPIAPPLPAHDWPQFRGSNTDGISSADGTWEQGAGLAIAWKIPLGSGYSGVSVYGDHVVTMFSDGESDVMVDLDAGNGSERWRFEMGPTYAGRDGSHDGPISTPLISGGRVFGLGPLGRLFALDLETGEILWSVDLVEEQSAKPPRYGFASSPFLQDGAVVVEMGAPDAAVGGFDSGTGKLLWSGGTDTINYQSPIPLALDGVEQILAAGDKEVFGIDPESGAVLWEYAHEGTGSTGMMSLVPVVAGDSRIFLAHKADGSMMLDLKVRDGVVVPTAAWENRNIRNSFNVPIYHDGHLYAFSSRFLTCVDAANGESVWRSRAPGDGFLILVDEHLVILTKEGTVHVAPATPSGYQERTSIRVFDDLAWSPPSFAGGSIYVRSHGELARVDLGSSPSTADRDRLVPQGTLFANFLAKVDAATDKKRIINGLLASGQAFPIVEEKGWITFLYRGPGEDLAVAGDPFGARQEQPMRRVEGTDIHYHTMRLEPDARINYVFLKNFKDAITDPLNPLETTTTLFGEDMNLSFSGEEMEMSWVSMREWVAPDHLKPAKRSRKGRMVTHELESERLESKHTIQVYLPAGYADSKRRYPVAYVHGGRDAIERGRIPNSVDNLIGERVDPVIVVFIDQSWFPLGAEEYSGLFAREVIPFIDGRYRTLQERESRASVGQGFAAYIAFFSALSHPELIEKVGGQTIFMLSSMQDELEPLVTSSVETPLDVYLEWGTYDVRSPHEAWDYGDSTRRFAELLEERGYWVDGEEVHDGSGWSSWRNRTDALFESLFPYGVHTQD
jgi:outer membrane protein assembly factor BamB/enterochelin esterase-like enzyme